jgi:hypothetical protein
MAAKTLGNQILDRLAEKFNLSVTKKPGRAQTCTPNRPLGAGNEYRVRRDIKRTLQRELRELDPFLLSRSGCGLLRETGQAHQRL